MVRAELHVHQARHPARRVGVLVVLHPLDEGTCAVAHTHDGYPYRTHEDCSYSFAAGAAGGGAGRSARGICPLTFRFLDAALWCREGLTARLPFRGDQLVEPADLALDRFQAVPVQFERVAVQPFPGPRHRRPDAVQPLLEPGPAAFQDAQPDVRAGLAEEGEPDAEPVVLPGRGAGLGEDLLQPLLALRGQPVDDLGTAAAPAACPPGWAVLPRSVPGRAGPSGMGRASRTRTRGTPRAGRSGACAARSRAWGCRAAARAPPVRALLTGDRPRPPAPPPRLPGVVMVDAAGERNASKRCIEPIHHKDMCGRRAYATSRSAAVRPRCGCAVPALVSRWPGGRRRGIRRAAPGTVPVSARARMRRSLSVMAPRRCGRRLRACPPGNARVSVRWSHHGRGRLRRASLPAPRGEVPRRGNRDPAARSAAG